MTDERRPRPRRDDYDDDDDRDRRSRGDFDDDDDRPRKKKLSSKESYNLVTDTVTGVNVRWKDNLFQGIIIFVFTLIGGLVGYFAIGNSVVGSLAFGVLAGMLGGMIVGTFLSGLIIMIYRAIRHGRGKHD